ncbi:MAG TPA: LLM class flavin-dependent oxidoreductase [Thermomicrobiales bacterium]|jgi:alkanesulfonate monooxygenase SsuD/methylene tetrahydromethanopterin reductase-like flavin-dependent oxidoreductase (luciferase family)|nr:LLM class flavin-dependent oxidoreductase [Thermomicrobiales bacterium]
MTDRLALAVIPGVGWRTDEIQDVAREAEAAGFEAIFSTEINNDAMATAQLMGSATERIQVGTWVANIYLRHSYTCAEGAALIAEATGGRFILGLGVSHQPVNGALGIAMDDPLGAFRRYLTDVRGWLQGEGPATHLPQRPAPVPVPLYVGSLTSSTVELGAELADGIMPLFWSVERVAQSKEWAARGRARAPELGPLTITLGLPTYVGDDLDALREVARQNLVLYTGLPFFKALLRVSGFADEATLMEQGDGMAGLSDRFLEATCLIGTPEQCRERLAEYRAAGVEVPILYPPIGVDGAREVIRAFRQ